MDGVLARRYPGAAGEHGTDAVRPAGRVGMGSRAVVVLDRRHAGADEFRVDPRRQPEVPPGDGGQAVRTDLGCGAVVGARLRSLPGRSTPPRGPSSPTIWSRPVRGPAPIRSCNRRCPGSCISLPDPRSTSSYENHQAPVRARRRRGVHGHVRGAGVSVRSGAGAGRAGQKPRGPVSERRQRRAQLADSLQRPVLPQPASHPRGAGGERAADRRPTPRASRSACIPGSPASNRSSTRDISR